MATSHKSTPNRHNRSLVAGPKSHDGRGRTANSSAGSPKRRPWLFGLAFTLAGAAFALLGQLLLESISTRARTSRLRKLAIVDLSKNLMIVTTRLDRAVYDREATVAERLAHAVVGVERCAGASRRGDDEANKAWLISSFAFWPDSRT